MEKGPIVAVRGARVEGSRSSFFKKNKKRKGEKKRRREEGDDRMLP